MDKLTSEYRKAQFKRIGTDDSIYKPKIKVVTSNGKTNWLDIENKELQTIIDVLTTINPF